MQLTANAKNVLPWTLWLKRIWKGGLDTEDVKQTWGIFSPTHIDTCGVFHCQQLLQNVIMNVLGLMSLLELKIHDGFTFQANMWITIEFVMTNIYIQENNLPIWRSEFFKTKTSFYGNNLPGGQLREGLTYSQGPKWRKKVGVEIEENNVKLTLLLTKLPLKRWSWWMYIPLDSILPYSHVPLYCEPVSW